MRYVLCLFVVTVISSPVDAQTFPQKLFGKLKGSASAEAGPVDRQLALARLSERHGQPEQAVKIYNKVLAQNPKHLLAHHRLAVVEMKQGQIESALEHFATAAQIQTPSSELLSDMGYAHYLAHDLPQAEAVLRQALQLDATSKAAANNLALVLGEQGKFGESFAQFRRAGDEATAFANLGYLQAQMGQLKEAEASYHKALDRDRNLQPAARALLQLAARRTSLEEKARRTAAATAEPLSEEPATAMPLQPSQEVAPVSPFAPQAPVAKLQPQPRPTPHAPQEATTALGRFNNPPVPSGPVASASQKLTIQPRQVAAQKSAVQEKQVVQASAKGDATTPAVVPADGFLSPIPIPSETAAPKAATIPKVVPNDPVGRVRVSSDFFE